MSRAGALRPKRHVPSFMHTRRSWDFWLLSAFILFVFLTGGGARADITSLIFLRPAAFLLCAYALWRTGPERLRQFKWTIAGALILVFLPVLHVVPMPASMWQGLSGREVVSEIDRTSTLGYVWRPLSIAPRETINALYSLAVPLAVLLMGMAISYDERRRLILVVLTVLLLSALLGLLQIVLPGAPGLYFYRVTNPSSSVGLFANRNHQALMLATLFPIVAVFASSRSGLGRKNSRRLSDLDAKLVLVGALGIVLVPMILITGSRAGVLSMVIGLAFFPFLFRGGSINLARLGRKGTSRLLLSAGAVLLVAVTTALMSRAEALQRLFASNTSDESRVEIWQAVADSAWHYFPWGSGVGSFVPAFQVLEPGGMLTPEYLNHAHNDFLEVIMTSGVPGALLLVAAIAAWLLMSIRWFRRPLISDEVRYGRLACILLLMFGVASFVDYPVRVPSVACVFILAVLWGRGDEGRISTVDQDGLPASQ